MNHFQGLTACLWQNTVEVVQSTDNGENLKQANFLMYQRQISKAGFLNKEITGTSFSR